jgi:uncharacterized protein YraI
MKKIRLSKLVLVVIILLAACTSTPTSEPTAISTLMGMTSTPSIEPSVPSETSVVTTPVPVSIRTPRPPTPVPSLPPLPDDVGSNVCPGTQPSMLMPGRQGRVSNATPDPNRVRAEPNAQAAILGEIPAGAYFDVLEGPRCAEDAAWFKVRYEAIEGWMKEGSSTEYWVMPITSDAHTVNGPAIEVSGLTLNIPEELSPILEIQEVPYNAAENRPPATLIRLLGYPIYDPSPAIFIYQVDEYLYYRADLRPRLVDIRSTINNLLINPDAQVNLPEFRDAFIEEQTFLMQGGRFNNGYGWGLRGVTVTDDAEKKPYYVFMGFSEDMSSLVYVKLPVRLTFGQLSNTSVYNFSPSIAQLDSLLGFQPVSELPTITDPTAAGACPDAPPFTLMVGDWARVSVDPPLASRIRSGPGSGGTVLGEAQPGENLLVIDGPQCANGYTWWNVRSLSGLEGWAAEGDSLSYWLVEPISPWYQLPPPVASGNLVRYSLREINISAPAAFIYDFSSEYYPLATPMPTPATIETPWPDDPRASIYTYSGHSAHSSYRMLSDVTAYGGITVYNIEDPLSRFYVHNASYNSCTESLRENLQNDPPVEAYIQYFCGIGGGIPVMFIADVQPIEFTGGSGLRFLLSSGNNLTVNGLDYIFQGLSDDGRYYIVAMVMDVLHPYIVDANLLWEGDFGPLLAWSNDLAEASYDVFNERIETLLAAQVVPTYPDLLLLDAMMASIEIK